MSNFSDIDKKLAEFAEGVPANGMHISYLLKASELMNLYGEVLSIMEDEETLQNQGKVEKIFKKMEKMLGE